MTRTYLLQMGLVGIGGFAGAVLRFAASGWVHQVLPTSRFPVGTLAVNVAGCLAIGFLGGLAEVRHLFSPELRLLLFLGLLGGFTTFSTLAFETLTLARSEHWPLAVGNVVAHLVLGLGGAWLAYLLARSFAS
jgi:CrcB protein